MRRKTDKYPYWAYGSFREFKSEKREYVKEALRVLSGDGQRGIAFSPAYEKLEQARKLLREADELQSIKNWGR
jgi:hypothetical protein